MSRRLSKCERATAAASLLEMRGLGIDTCEVERSAEAMIRMGTPEPQAWGKAFSKAMDAQPALRAPLMRIEKLMERVDTHTLARYSVALESAYVTGDDTALQSLAPEVAQDLSQLARETGDAGFADMASGAASAVSTTSEAPPSPAAAPTREGWGHTGYRACEAGNPASGGHGE